MIKFLYTVLVLSALFSVELGFAQKAGKDKSAKPNEEAKVSAERDSTKALIQDPSDTLYVFEPSHSLLQSAVGTSVSHSAYGPHVVISGNGYGFGFFYQTELDANTMLMADFFASGARNTAEFEVQDGYYIYVPNKVHRVFILPFMIAINRTLFAESMSERMRPYLIGGVGLNCVLVGSYDPYSSDFFQSIGSSVSYLRPGAFVGVGAAIQNTEKSTISFDARYYYLPFGGDGIESIRNVPMREFNGLFLSLSVGFR